MHASTALPSGAGLCKSKLAGHADATWQRAVSIDWHALVSFAPVLHATMMTPATTAENASHATSPELRIVPSLLHEPGTRDQFSSAPQQPHASMHAGTLLQEAAHCWQ